MGGNGFCAVIIPIFSRGSTQSTKSVTVIRALENSLARIDKVHKKRDLDIREGHATAGFGIGVVPKDWLSELRQWRSLTILPKK